MKENSYGGLLVCLDGPNGSGKSTLISEIIKEIPDCNVINTAEPTKTKLGSTVRKLAEEYDKEILACLVAADRYYHLTNFIIPNLKKNQIVICDRYILSSLILQRMDGVSQELIMKLNSEVLLPDLQVVVLAKENTLQKRLKERKFLTRFESSNLTKKEINFTQYRSKVLKNLGVQILEIDNDKKLNNNVDLICFKIKQMAMKKGLICSEKG